MLYSSTRAAIRYENLVGDRFMEITSGPGNCEVAVRDDEQPARHSRHWILTRVGRRPWKALMLTVNTISSSAVIQLLTARAGRCRNVADTSAFSSRSASATSSSAT